MGSIQRSITVHGRHYKVPEGPVVVVCIDGFDPTYLSAGCEDGITPNMASFIESGFHTTATCAMPSLTNPNNMSIITGAPTAAHGVSGNYYLDKKTGQEHMVLDDASTIGTTILEQLAGAGVRVAAITAKDKLRRIINRGLFADQGAICFSAQCAGECTMAEAGIEDVEAWLGRGAPPQYSGDLSLFVLDAGIKLLQEGRADLYYLTLSDYIQHKHAPRSAEADWFMCEVDKRLGELIRLGAVVAVTGDHGMSDKADPEGNPNVLFLEDAIHAKWPEAGARVICPITDPFVKHHGALGGFVRVHLLNDNDTAKVAEMVSYCRTLPEVEAAYTGREAAALFEMPVDREGDLVVIASKNAVIGGRKDEHDLTALKGHRLRSHGGLSEQAIPLLRSRPLQSKNRDAATDRAWRNFDVFDVALNY
ncbi:phosphonoacetate hydrolase [Cyphellophora europaea CBS 101466]|uniref:Phosphonoacetate hydrolase n=1 Tax=Cyphellophora europaea (strain CBS 101466) TaxID=1220924 RepID=W2S1W4_CYPE1|nr:phosphonoacetate hydrolase [Cyphellophora europaea CBS 101466]ETN42038.1 phosphonoacetate hydrolase [Cyphellophora europaea CBS 101466]